MKKRWSLLAILLLALSTSACNQLNARIKIKQANDEYAKEDYALALKHYSDARKAAGDKFPDLDRLIGYCNIGMFKPEDKSPQNLKYVDTAVAELQSYLQKKPEDMAARETLINLFLNADRTNDAINFFRDYLKSHPADIDAVKSIATLFAKQGNFEESLNWYEKVTLLQPNKAETFYVFGVVCYENVAKNPNVRPEQKPGFIDRGQRALARALQLQPDYFEAAVYMNLLYREAAKLEVDPLKQQTLLAKADEFRNMAIGINKKRKEQQQQKHAA